MFGLSTESGEHHVKTRVESVTSISSSENMREKIDKLRFEKYDFLSKRFFTTKGVRIVPWESEYQMLPIHGNTEHTLFSIQRVLRYDLFSYSDQTQLVSIQII